MDTNEDKILFKDLSYKIVGLVEDKIILELKSVEEIINTHISQALNYLKATGLQLAIILNFGKNGLEHERLVR